MNFLKSISTVGGYTIASRIGGFVREILTASFLGAGASTDALAVAIKLPAFFRRLFAEGAFNACFVPLFAGLWATKGPQEAKLFARQILTFLVLVLFAFVVSVEIFLPDLLPVLLPGFARTPERLELLIEFTRVTFPFIFFISLTALYSGILNSLDRFTAVASSPLAGNVFIIFFVFIWGHAFSPPGYAFALAILGSGVVQMIWVMVPLWKADLTLKPTAVAFSGKKNPMAQTVRDFFKLLGPAALGSGVVQVNLFVGAFIASWLPVGSISYLNYADRLNQLPLSVIGIAISTALLPLLSRQLRSGATRQAHESQAMAIEVALFLSLPAALALIFLAQPLVMVLFQHGVFSAQDTHQTAQTLAAYACGLPAYVMVKVLSSRFFAASDTRTPLLAGAISIGVDIVLSLALMQGWQHVGIALATSVAAWVNTGVLVFFLLKRGDLEWTARLRHFSLRLVVTGVVTIFVLEGLLFSLASLLNGVFMAQIVAVFLLVFGGLAAFLLLAKIFKAVDYKEFFRLLSQPLSSPSTGA